MQTQKEVYRIVTSFPEWERLCKDYESKNSFIAEVLKNLAPVAIINQTLYIEFIGKAENKKNIEKSYLQNKLEIQSILVQAFNIATIANSSKLDEVKLSWLKQLIETYTPMNISFNVFK